MWEINDEPQKALEKNYAGRTHSNVRLCPSGFFFFFFFFKKWEKSLTCLLDMRSYVWTVLTPPTCDWQVSCDSLDGRRSQQHCQMPKTHRRPRAVPHIPDPPRIKGENFKRYASSVRWPWVSRKAPINECLLLCHHCWRCNVADICRS